MQDTAPGATQTEEPPKRSGRTGRDMAVSLIVLLIPLALIVGIFRLRGGEDVVVIDPSAAIGEARASGLFPVAAPDRLGRDWRPISAGFTAPNGTGTLRVGYITPHGGTVQLVETNEDPQSLVPRELGPDGQSIGPVDVGGVSWRSYQARGTEHALVLTSGNRTMIVQGQASDDELRELAAAVS